MNRSVTVSLRGVAVALVALLGLVAAYLVGAGGGGGPAPAQGAAEQDAQQARTVRVVGKGTATAVPDRLVFQCAVSAKRASLEDALSVTSATMRRVLATVARHGVAKSDTRTTGLSMSPEYYYPSSGPPVLSGYRVTQRLEVKVAELAEGGATVSAVVAVGDGVRVSSLRLVVGDPEAAVRAAREAAVAEAKAKAEQYADTTGATLGQVQSVREVSAPAQVRPIALSTRAAYAARQAALPIRAGSPTSPCGCWWSGRSSSAPSRLARSRAARGPGDRLGGRCPAHAAGGTLTDQAPSPT
ncbi:MAG: SIMPL domain-containing protein [Nocardioides sp.]